MRLFFPKRAVLRLEWRYHLWKLMGTWPWKKASVSWKDCLGEDMLRAVCWIKRNRKLKEQLQKRESTGKQSQRQLTNVQSLEKQIQELQRGKKKSRLYLKLALSTSAKKMNFITSENASNLRNRIKTGDLCWKLRFQVMLEISPAIRNLPSDFYFLQ